MDNVEIFSILLFFVVVFFVVIFFEFVFYAICCDSKIKKVNLQKINSSFYTFKK